MNFITRQRNGALPAQKAAGNDGSSKLFGDALTVARVIKGATIMQFDLRGPSHAQIISLLTDLQHANAG